MKMFQGLRAIKIFKVFSHTRWLAVLMLILFLAVTFVAWLHARNITRERARILFEHESAEIATMIRERMNIYTNVLYGAVGLFAASKLVERDEWRAYCEKLKIFERIPGLVALRFIERVKKENKEAFIQSVREDTTLSKAGYPDFKIHPDQEKEEYFIVKYIEPFAGNEKMHGLDLSWEPLRWQALEEARDTGQLSATGRITLVIYNKETPCFLVSLPVYRNKAPASTIEERRAALVGFVDVAFEARKLFYTIFGGAEIHPNIDVHVYDGEVQTDEHLLYDNDLCRQGKVLPYKPSYSTVENLEVAGRKWYLLLKTQPAFGLTPSEELLPKLILFGGLLFSFLGAGFLYSLGTSRARALTLAEKMTRDLRRSEEQIRNLMDHANDAIVSADKNGNIIMWNQQAQKIFGYTPMETLNQPLTIIIPERYQKAHLEGIKRVTSGGPSRIIGKTIEVEGRRKDGTEFPMELSLSKMGEGSEIYFTGIIRDISERKKAEEELRQSEEQLRQSQKMETVGQLAGGVAHDFNNLLTAIIGYCELALYKLEPDNPLHKDVGEIKRAANRAATLTRQLLAFGRKQIFQPKVLHLNEVLLEMDKMLRRLIGEEIELKTVLSPALGWARADQAQIEQVISNLILNARDAMPSGGIMTVETRNSELDENYTRNHVDTKAGSFIMVAVTDTGSGMNAETKSHLFEPFFTTKDKAKTSGLGLSTAYGIVKQSGGHISVYSEVGKGSTFKVYLPRVQAAADRKEKAKPAAPAPAGKATVLLVEDEEILRELARTVLERSGYEVLSAGNGVEALALSEKHTEPIHILVTDVVMPKMNGRELAERLTALRPEIKVLYMSGYTDDAVIQRILLEPGAAFLPKPFTPSVFVSKVREMLE